jgi:hypothetical protein
MGAGPFKVEDIQYRLTGVNALRKRQQAYDEASGLIGALIKRNFFVVIEAPKPVFRSPPFRCSDWFNAHNPACASGFVISREELLQDRQPVMESMASLQKSFPGLTIWDPFPILCPDEVCRAVTKAGPLFFDGDHLSGLANRLLYPQLASLLNEVWRTTPDSADQGH